MNRLIKTVINNDMCIGCGACAYITSGKFEIRENIHGFFYATATEKEIPTASKDAGLELSVCPFSNESENEDLISESVFDKSLPNHPKIGKFISCYAGRVVDDEIYNNSSSGGIGRWILAHLIEQGEIDGVVSVFDSPVSADRGKHFEYRIARSAEEVLNASKSAYYPVEMSSVLQEVREKPGRYAITGVPCFIKAVRNLCRVDPILKERIIYTIGIVCGHLKGRYYAELLGWQLGVHPNELRSIDFRKKIPGKRANEKGVTAARKSDTTAEVPCKTVKEMFGTDYGLGLFKYNACDYCDDVVAETADISIGDAWLPEYMESGTSLVIVRNKRLHGILEGAITSGTVTLAKITADQAAQSQDAGFRHRREGLSYRLFRRKKEELWSPIKRVSPVPLTENRKYQRIFKIRAQVIPLSIEGFEKAKQENDLAGFEKKMNSVEKKYSIAYSTGVKRLVRFILFRLGIHEEAILRLIRK